jgi:hypothetical protein
MNVAVDLQKNKNDFFWRPSRIVSLWEMQEFLIDLWFEVFHLTGKFSAACEIEDAVSGNFQKLEVICAKWSAFFSLPETDFPKSIPLPISPDLNAAQVFEKVSNELMELGLAVAAESAQELAATIKTDSKITWQKLKPSIDEFMRNIRRELKSKRVIMISSSKVSYFDGFADSSSTIIKAAFPSAEYDLDEAAKCFAVERYTACVFHTMRALEPGLKALGAYLGLAVETNWNKALDQIEKEIRARSVRTHGVTWKNDEPFCTQAATHFRFVKNAWRNHTMHLEERYDEERAKKVLTSVTNFMSDIAGKLHE